jgi:hypothetical protein
MAAADDDLAPPALSGFFNDRGLSNCFLNCVLQSLWRVAAARLPIASPRRHKCAALLREDDAPRVSVCMVCGVRGASTTLCVKFTVRVVRVRAVRARAAAVGGMRRSRSVFAGCTWPCAPVVWAAREQCSRLPSRQLRVAYM